MDEERVSFAELELLTRQHQRESEARFEGPPEDHYELRPLRCRATLRCGAVQEFGVTSSETVLERVLRQGGILTVNEEATDDRPARAVMLRSEEIALLEVEEVGNGTESEAG